ncbi:MAG: 16S rRNA (guanine(527)-N(7))-methyltransferase RsmG [Paraglaciecola sp.]|uniref:16S rRNA (guanine(527)-N(7))-methyltransferase RsmG n=1 Tax=Paraglaciecola sp. TaxID=1920173 RepID=UPI00273ED126|nr:16S rRNA (guanine(527)-N(7))-methyltransferase RsmG [Paraglaciecola sp.]MDP5031167.1 16S rRNA (guanine(527)-N(7))-methyltransferase RsmG [Paraglaciecola sp.]MDP5039367.1 16S rRNA (guanine(527)-N(7))-methyltransferase RsmG [Paraglaciecola sp.]MDP5132104.1 16S rRNA (guanine(527)-N(7))-methyltransferase RsmG [Paraglaciecola sp.]
MEVLKEQLIAQLNTVLKDSDIQPNVEQVEKLVAYVLLMHKWNKAYNLTSVREPEQMLIKHIVDSIVVAPFLTEDNYIDVGTGPGLPGIPLAIMCPEKYFVLLDSLGKRVRFMKQVAYELKLNNIEPIQSRVEDYQPLIHIQGVISRAFASLKDMLHWCQHLVDSQGVFLALKGQLPRDELKEIGDDFNITEIIALSVPNLVGERHIIKIQKK